MAINHRITSNQLVKVTILATHKLTCDYLNVLLDGDGELSVIDVASTSSEVLAMVSRNMPDVVLICVVDGEGQEVDVINDLFRIAPQAKVLILSSPNSQLDQPAALKLGVTGIVGTNQNIKTLTRAIKQVAEGGVWLNQKLVEQLLNGRYDPQSVPSRSNGYYKLDDLTNRELEVIERVGTGMNNKEISKVLCISEATVRHHLSSIYSKLAIEDRLNLAIYAYRQGIVCPPAAAL